METLVRDVRLALKLLWKDKTFSVTVLLTLAVCIGVNVAIYSVIHTVLLDPLPFKAPDRLVTIFNSYPNAGAPRAGDGTIDFLERRKNVPAFQEVALFQDRGATVGGDEGSERVTIMRVSPSLFPLLGVQAALGRTFTEDEMEEGNHRKVLLTDAYWRERFGGARDAVGREMRVNGEAYTVVGVLPPDFAIPAHEDARFFVPVPFTEADRQMDRWHSNNFELIARLAPGATIEQARAQNDALNQTLIDRWPVPNGRQLIKDAGYQTVIVPAAADLVRDVRSVLYMLWAGVGLVLLIGCVNIANLVLARAQTRVGDIATRLALGAPRGRVARQVLTEAVVMGLVGGALGVGIGAIALKLFLRFGAAQLPRGTAIGIDTSVLFFTAVVAVGAGLLFGAIPMVQIMRGDLSPVFRTDARTGTASRRSVLVRNALVTSQVALAFVLLIGAGLMLMSFRAALAVDPGFDADGVMTAFVSLPDARYPDRDARRRFSEELRAGLLAIPGVKAAAITAALPFTSNSSSSVIVPEGYVPSPGESVLSPLEVVASPGYFEAMGIELVEGRTFSDSDGPDAPQVMLIDEWLAHRYWPDRSPLGDRMVYGVPPTLDSIPPESVFTIVGVVKTTKNNDLTAPASEHVGTYYFSSLQQPPSFQAMVVRAGLDPASITPALRALVTKLDSDLPLYGVETMRGRIDDSLRSRRSPLILLGVFAGVALFLAVVGIYGALAYTVAQRTREIGIRMAMGSAPRDVFRSVVGQGLRVTGLGLVVGAVASVLLTRLVRSLLFDVRPTDPRVMAAVAVVLGVVGLAACMIPARRATTVDPVSALGGG